MITTSWILTLVTVVFIPVFMFGGLLLAKRSRKYYSSQQAALGAINGYMEETVTGQKVIKVFNHEDECEEEFGLLNDDMRDKQFKAQFWGGVTGPIMGNTSQVSYAATVGIGGVLMIFGKIMDVLRSVGINTVPGTYDDMIECFEALSMRGITPVACATGRGQEWVMGQLLEQLMLKNVGAQTLEAVFRGEASWQTAGIAEALSDIRLRRL